MPVRTIRPFWTTGPTCGGATILEHCGVHEGPEASPRERVDWRADLWAFGVRLLCEMLTAQKPFKGDDLSETLAAMIKVEPKLERVPAKAATH